MLSLSRVWTGLGLRKRSSRTWLLGNRTRCFKLTNSISFTGYLCFSTIFAAIASPVRSKRAQRQTLSTSCWAFAICLSFLTFNTRSSRHLDSHAGSGDCPGQHQCDDGDGDDVHAALYRAISMDRHGTHPTQLDQKDDRSQTTRLQGESFYYTCIKANFNFF